jgi:hypothetical protein
MIRSFTFLAIISFAALTSCEESTARRYKLLEKNELASGIRQDSLFKGIYLGMSRKDFREYCYYMNTVEHEFKNDGPHTSWVISRIRKGMKYPAAINFYPVFRNEVIISMDAAIFYDFRNGEQAPYTKASLLEDVLRLLRSWYGAEFFRIAGPTTLQEDVYVSVRGNRRVIVYPTLTSEVRVRMQDLSVLENRVDYE